MTKINKKKVTRTSPFKHKDILENEIKTFANKFKATVVNQASRISDFFEMSCYNHIVTYYENMDYEVTIENLQKGKYRYKCSPSGVQSNFSYFQLSKKVNGVLYEFELQHNLAVESSQSNFIFTTPDISIIKKGKVCESITYYDTKRRFCYVSNENLISFIEVKQFNPFPELLFNFIGVVDELRKDVMIKTDERLVPNHIAPSLMISGQPNKPAQRIIDQLHLRYCINIIPDIFHSGAYTFSRGNVEDLRCVGEMSSS